MNQDGTSKLTDAFRSLEPFSVVVSPRGSWRSERGVKPVELVACAEVSRIFATASSSRKKSPRLSCVSVLHGA